MELVSLTPEGRIALALRYGKHRYSELRFETGLSDRWLTVKLKELQDEGVVRKDGDWHALGKDHASSCELSLYMILQARRLAGELAQLDSVRTVILYGSAVRKRAHEYSDLDMIIVVDKGGERVRELIASEISAGEKIPPNG